MEQAGGTGGRVAEPPDRFRLLFVCTGNICRSPFAQFHTRFLLEARLGPRQAARFQVASAGIAAVVGSGMHPLSRAQLTTRRDHPEVAAFRARQLPDRDVTLADLVLAVSRDHRGRVLEDVPQALPKAFTVPEFARLLEAAPPGPLPPDPVARARALVAAALATRGSPAPVTAEEDEVPDPVRGDESDHAAAAEVVDTAVRVFLDRLAPPVPPRPPVPPPRPGPPRLPPGWRFTPRPPPESAGAGPSAPAPDADADADAPLVGSPERRPHPPR